MTRLRWVGVRDRPAPDCEPCLDRWTDPLWTASVHSVSIEHPQSAWELGKQAIERYHRSQHTD